MLGWRARFQNGDVSCVLCGADEETIEHFVLQCESLAEVRVRNGVTAGDTLQKVLLFEGGLGEEALSRREFLSDLWRVRKTLKEQRVLGTSQ